MTVPVTVVGLGPADADFMGAGVRRLIETAPRLLFRTVHHPAANAFDAPPSADDIYDSAPSIDDVYPAVLDRLADLGRDGAAVVYVVPGSPSVAEHTVELLRSDPRFDLTVVPAMAFTDLVWDRLGIDPFAVSPTLIDGHRFSIDAAGRTGPLLVGQVDSPDVLSEIDLAFDDPPESATVLQRLGLDTELVRDIAWADLHAITPDPLTTLWIPTVAVPIARAFTQFGELVHTLRWSCPWDREQTHASLTRHLVEEAYEVLDAIAALPDGAGTLGSTAPSEIGDERYAHLREELGDLLYQVFFHAELAAEAGQFTMSDIALDVHDKLRDRHPHVFEPEAAAHPTSEELSATWEQRKLVEKGRASVMDGIPLDLPALALAWKVQRKAESAGFDLAEDLGVTGIAAEMWDAVQRARVAGVDPEAALRSLALSVRQAVMKREG